MTMAKLENTIRGLECCKHSRNFADSDCTQCPYKQNGLNCVCDLMNDALTLLKEQEQATIEPHRMELGDETKEWLGKMDAVEALTNIADICIDWDGFRTANGLGELINEIWAYARYCAECLKKAQGPRLMTIDEARSIAPGTVVWEVERYEDENFNSIPGQPFPVCVESVGQYKFMGDDQPTEAFFFAAGMDRVDFYGRDYVFWTDRPSEEQMEGVEWE